MSEPKKKSGVTLPAIVSLVAVLMAYATAVPPDIYG
jgi:hypothetical protein